MDDSLATARLVRQAQSGDDAALSQLLDQHQGVLFAVAYRALGNYADAQDSVAITLLQVCLHLTQLKEPQHAGAWIQAILRNEIKRFYSKTKQIARLSDEIAVRFGSDPVAHTIRRVDIARALSTLPANQAHSVRLFYLEGLPVSAIAERTGRSETTIKTWLQRGRRHLAAQLKGYDTMTKPPGKTTPTAHTEAPKQNRAALLIPDTVEPVLIDRVAEKVRREGYEPTRVPLAENLDSYENVFRLRQQFQAFVFAEPLGDGSALEYVLLLNARSKPFPIAVVAVQPLDSLRANMFHAAKAGNIVTWDDIRSENEMTLLKMPERDMWQLFNQAANGILVLARDEAALLKADAINTGHLLLALLRQMERRNIAFHDPESLERIVPVLVPIVHDQICQRIPASSTPVAPEMLRPAPDLQKALEQIRSRVEQTGRPVTPEDLLRIVFQDPESVGGQILRELGISVPEKVPPPRNR